MLLNTIQRLYSDNSTLLGYIKHLEAQKSEPITDSLEAQGKPDSANDPVQTEDLSFIAGETATQMESD